MKMVRRNETWFFQSISYIDKNSTIKLLLYILLCCQTGFLPEGIRHFSSDTATLSPVLSQSVSLRIPGRFVGKKPKKTRRARLRLNKGTGAHLVKGLYERESFDATQIE